MPTPPSNVDETAKRSYAITGASGLIGTELIAALVRDASTERILRVTRSPEGPDSLGWDPASGVLPAEPLEGIDVVFHLAGESIADGRWSAEKKRRIVDSRVNGTKLVATTLAGLERKPTVLVCASAVGFYGDRGDECVHEDSPAGTGFLADGCVAWEQAADPARAAGIRVVHARLGIVLAKSGGALKAMLTPFKLGLGGHIGSGMQWMSYVALPDVVGCLRFVADNEAIDGPFNVVNADAVRNKEFTHELAVMLNRPSILPLPTFAVKLLFGQKGEDLLLASTRVAPSRAQTHGYEFACPDLDSSLRAALADAKPAN